MHLIEHGELGVAADERRQASRLRVPARRRRGRPRAESDLPLSSSSPIDSSSNAPSICCAVAGPTATPPRPGRGLQARRGVDRVAERVEALLVGRLVGKQHDGAGVDADAAGELDAVRVSHVLRVAGQHRLHRQRCAHRALCVVVVRVRHAEERVQTVAGELRDRAAEALHLAGEQARHLVEEELRALRSELLADRRRVGDIGQKHRNDAPLACRHGHLPIIAFESPQPGDLNERRLWTANANPRSFGGARGTRERAPTSSDSTPCSSAISRRRSRSG